MMKGGLTLNGYSFEEEYEGERDICEVCMCPVKDEENRKDMYVYIYTEGERG